MANYNTLYAQNLKATAEQQRKDIEAQNKIYDAQRKMAEDQYGNKITELDEDYSDLFRQNEVQRLIDQRQLQENMANMGLRDSGLNRNQSTALQLAYGNRGAKLGREKQRALNEYSLALASAVTDIENNRTASVSQIEQGYSELAAKNAQSQINAEIEAQEKLQEAALKAQGSTGAINISGGLLSKNMAGSLADNGVEIVPTYETDEFGDRKIVKYTYIDNITGKKSTFDAGVNPYTGTVNKDIAGGTFDNGYQPNNVGGLKLMNTGITDVINGKVVPVYKTANGTMYIWDEYTNEYMIYRDNAAVLDGTGTRGSNSTGAAVVNPFTAAKNKTIGKGVV